MPLYLFVTKKFLEFLEDQKAHNSRGIWLVVAICTLMIISLLLRYYFTFSINAYGLVIRKALTGFIFRKVVKLSQSSLAKATAGKLVNLASGDMNVIHNGIISLPNLILAPLASLANIFFIYLIIGNSTFYTLIIIILLHFLQIPINRYFANIRPQIAKATDSRLNLINQLILGIATIKMYSWEEPMIQATEKARRVECTMLLKRIIMRSISEGLNRNVRVLLWIPVILVRVLRGQILEASSIFVMMNMVGSLGFVLIYRMNQGFTSLAEYPTVMKRIEEVLLLEEVEKQSIHNSAEPSVRVRMENINSTWGLLPQQKGNGIDVEQEIQSSNKALKEEEDIQEPLLKQIEQEVKEQRLVNKELNFTLQDGALLTVIGKVGAGKSSLLATVMGETKIVSGIMERGGSMAYVEQEPCILSDTVRNNILFGLPLDEARLSQVVEVCELSEDIKLFARGLDTEIGERGINISGGQKARVSLARACYSDADIYLLDDPLSAVDPNVAQKLFTKCIHGFLRNKATILVTHQVSFLPRVKRILVLEAGEQTFQGNYEELKEFQRGRGSELSEILSQFQRQIMRSPNISLQSLSRRASVISPLLGSMDQVQSIIQEIEPEQLQQQEKGNLIIKEEKQEGDVSWRTYFNHFNLTGSWILNILALLFGLSVPILNGYLRIFITSWVSAPLKDQDSSYFINLYIILSITIILVSIIATLSIVSLFLHFSHRLHNKMLKSVTRATILFFDSNPLGRIINRFSEDTITSDNTLPAQISYILGSIWQCAVYVAMSLFIFPQLILVILVLFFGMYYVRRIALVAQMDSLRYSGITRSPVNSMFSATLTGLLTMRAYNKTDYYERKFFTLVDHNGRALFSYNASSRWMGFYLDFLSLLYILCTIGLSFILKSSGINTALLALGITSTMSLVGPIMSLISQTANVANSMTSIQRMQEYSSLKSEPPALLNTDAELKSNGWPQRGDLQVFNANMRYRENFPLVLKNVSFEVGAGMKIGVVGRTGAGKSSLLKILFRLSECEPGSQILIDEVKTREIGLRTLRKAVSIIPQSPFIFEGTVRENLDPFLEYEDRDLWEVLSDVQLKEYVMGFRNGLKQEVSDGTSVFSVGQKQLICLARAILRNNKILVMDEATANVDRGTEALIQEKIREKFSDCTVVTIAHRLDTVIESDKILVMKEGEAIEFAHPHSLLENEDSQFSGMVQATGFQSEKVLRNRAKKAFDKIH